MRDIFIASCVRTAIGSFGGSLKGVPATSLGAVIVNQVLKRAGLRPKVDREAQQLAPRILEKGITPLEEKYISWEESSKEIVIDEVILGNVLQGGQGQNVARQAMIYGGLHKETPAFTVNKVCASGLKSISLAYQAILGGSAEAVIAGGVENMSSAPYFLPKARWGYRMNLDAKGEIMDLMVYDGLWEIFYNCHMGVTAENIAKTYKIERQEQDEFGFHSHQKALAAIEKGVFKEEICPVQVPQPRGEEVVFETDERPMKTSLEKMAKLRPVFKKNGTVTAGNASGINDGGAGILMASEDVLKQYGLSSLGRIVSFASAGVDPAYMGLGVVPAVKKALKIADLKIEEIDLVELNEAFAAQAIACIKELDIDPKIVNVNGGGVALGHPIGCTGARLIVTLLMEMRRRNAHLGLATLCIGGGQGMAMVVEH